MSKQFFAELSAGNVVVSEAAQMNASRCRHSWLRLGAIAENPGIAIIIGGGPTLNDVLPDGRTRLQDLDARSDIKVLAGSAQKLVTEGLLARGADLCVMNNPAEAAAPDAALPYYLGLQPVPGMTYLVPSFYAPQIGHHFQQAAQCEVLYFHPLIAGLARGEGLHDQEHDAIGVGSTSATAALALMAAAYGVKQFEFYGVDGAVFTPNVDPNSYVAYDMAAFKDHPSNADLLVVGVGQNHLQIRRGQWSQLCEIHAFMSAHPDMRCVFHGHSLMAMVLNGGHAVTLIHDAKGQVPAGASLVGLRLSGSDASAPASAAIAPCPNGFY